MRISFVLAAFAASFVGGLAVFGGPDNVYDNLDRVVSTPAYAAEAAILDVNPGPAINFDELIRVGDQDYQVTHNGVLNTENVLGTDRIKVVGHGEVSFVNVVRTPTGTFSSDGMVSPHVLYPGIEVKRMEAQAAGKAAGGAFSWVSEFGWVPLSQLRGQTITDGRMFGGGSFVNFSGTTCVRAQGYRSCS